MTNFSGICGILILPSVTGVALFFFFLYHCYLASSGVTTNESLKKSNTEAMITRSIHRTLDKIDAEKKAEESEERQKTIKELEEKLGALRKDLEVAKNYSVKQSLYNIFLNKI